MASSLRLLDAPSRPTRAGVVAWLALLVAYVVGVAVVMVRADRPWPPLTAVPVAHAVSMAVVTGLTALLLFAHASRSGIAGYLVLGATFSSVAVILMTFPLVFPGALVSPDDGADPQPLLGTFQSSVALFYLWHLVVLIGIPACAVTLRRERSRPHGTDQHQVHVGWAVLLGTVPAGALALWTLWPAAPLPALTAPGGITDLAATLDRIMVLLALVSLAITAWATRADSVIGRWLLTVSVLSTGEALVNLNAQRFSVGWYFNRALGFVALSALLVVLVLVLAKVERSAHRMATRDPLTGVLSRSTFDDEMAREIAHSRHDGLELALLWVDLDRFKSVNDEHGHQAGDELLVATAGRIRAQVRACDLVVRMGGDEFAVLLTELGSRDAAITIADRLTDALARPITVRGTSVITSASVGLTFLEDSDVDADDLIRRADHAMYVAKARGGAHALLWSQALEADRGA